MTDTAVAKAEQVAGERPVTAQAAVWPQAEGAHIIFLLDATSPLEERTLRQWIESNAPSGAPPFDAVTIPPSRRPRVAEAGSSRLEAVLATGDDPLLAPLRVIWLPKSDAERSAHGLLKMLAQGDPYDPGRLKQWWLARRDPDRYRIVAGEPARLSELRERWRAIGGSDFSETTGLSDFVVRQAGLALERAERRVRGMRYKVPRFVAESIVQRPAFQGGLARLAWESGRDVADVSHEAGEYLREIAATHSRYMIDLAAQLCRLLYTRGYAEELHYDRDQLERIYAKAQRLPVCFLPSHRSNLDHLVLQYALYENGHPPNHTAGGINMNFFPLGALFRHSGVFFIRRSFKDNEVYKFVLRSYIGYLIEKRFPLEWYIEGGRSRSGKLLPPRFGMVAYVVDAYRRAKSEDVILVPVSITYDQIQDVGSYVAEQQGAEKEREGLGWFWRMFQSLRRRYGGIYIRFGEPVSLRETLGTRRARENSEVDEQNLEVQKVAFEVSVRINRVTPFTPTSLVTLALLAAGDRALTTEETAAALTDICAYVRRRKLPTTEPFDPNRLECVQAALDALIENGVVTCYTGGPQAVFAIGPNQHLTAAYYRNTVAHFLVTGSIAELALLRAAEDDAGDPEGRFWAETLALRDLLKFEFFFSEKEQFRSEISDEIGLHDPEWRTVWRDQPPDLRELLQKFRPFSAHLVLRPFLEAYRVVGDALERQSVDEEVDAEKFLDHCLGLGKQYHLQKRLRGAESVSKVLFATALRLARNRRLVDPGHDDLAARRKAFASEIRDVIRRVEAIDALAASRRAGLID